MRWLMSVVILMMMLSGCGGGEERSKSILRPMPWLLKHYPKDAPQDYVDGWQDGCETGMASMSNDYYRTFYKYRIDQNRIKLPLYYKPWKDAYNYCRHYVYGPLREANLRQKLPSGSPGDFYNPTGSPLSTIYMQRLWSGEGSDQW